VKNLPFLIVIFVALLITYLSPALSSAQTITVSAYVPEHLSYFKDGEKITFSTNYEIWSFDNFSRKNCSRSSTLCPNLQSIYNLPRSSAFLIVAITPPD